MQQCDILILITCLFRYLVLQRRGTEAKHGANWIIKIKTIRLFNIIIWWIQILYLVFWKTVYGRDWETWVEKGLSTENRLCFCPAANSKEELYCCLGFIAWQLMTRWNLQFGVSAHIIPSQALWEACCNSVGTAGIQNLRSDKFKQDKFRRGSLSSS